MNLKLSKVFWIGFLVLFTSVFFFYGVRFLQDETFQNSMFTFKIVYKDAQGIDSGDDVQMLGKKIGYVKSTIIEGQNIVCEISINNEYKNSIPIDSKIEITQQDIMGSKIITIFPGKDTRKFILDGDTISGRNAEVVSLTQDIGDFAKKINSTFGNQQKQQIISTISNIEDFIKQLNTFITKNKDIIGSEDKENFHFILSNFSNISDKFKLILRNQKDNIEKTIKNAGEFSENLPELYEKINTTLTELKFVIKGVNDGDGSLGKFVKQDDIYNNANEFIGNANTLVVDAKDLISDVKKNPKKYIKAYLQASREDKRENK